MLHLNVAGFSNKSITLGALANVAFVDCRKFADLGGIYYMKTQVTVWIQHDLYRHSEHSGDYYDEHK